MAKDMMPFFELFQPTDVDDALGLLGRYGERGLKLAGGMDALGWLKDRGKRADVVIDLEGLEELKGIRETEGGAVEIGAMTTLTDVERSPLVRDWFPLLAEAARRVASPQIRNAGTLGGNLCQDTRCWYYRSGLSCYRAGGNVCYADTPVSMNREHALFGADRCVAVTPSDTAPALVALDAEMVVRSRGGERTLPAARFFMGPGTDITRMTVLDPEDLLTAVRIPNRWAGAWHRFEKVTDRGSWDFALVSLSSTVRLAGGVMEDCRLVAGAVQCVPRRLAEVEEVIRGRAPDEETAELAAAAATGGARPLHYNQFKVPLLENLVKRAVREAGRERVVA